MRLLTGWLSTINNALNCQVTAKRTMLKHSINHIISKKVMDRYFRLPMPCNKILATYVWIDGSGINMRCKDRILKAVPHCVEDCPGWAFDGSSCGQAATGDSDTKLKPAALYKDPFRMEPHIIVLCEVYTGDGKATSTNNRKFCADLVKTHEHDEPWFGLEQEYTMMDVDGWGLGWPKGGGFPAVKYEFSYCGVGAKYMAGRDVAEAHVRACLYAGMDFEGTNSEVCFGCWEWQVGTSIGMKAPDDLWMSRYLMNRVSEEYGVVASYHSKPFGELHPGMGMHHNFSTKRMRSEGGYNFILDCIKKLEKNHMKHMKNYGVDEAANRIRLSGKFETAPFEQFSWGIANRKASIRLQRGIKESGKGFFEDRRPGADCDPYIVCGLLMETCLGPATGGAGGQCPPPKCPPGCAPKC